jgi:soluble lytic murein transglycosylase-like protein
MELNDKICKVTRNNSLKWAIVIFVVILVGYSFFGFFFMRDSIVKSLDVDYQVSNLSVKYGMLEDKIEYERLVDKAKKIESKMFYLKKVYGIKRNYWSRLVKEYKDKPPGNHGEFGYLITNLLIIKKTYNVPSDFENFIFAIISAEVLWGKNCKSHAGAMGLFQLMPNTVLSSWRYCLLKPGIPSHKDIYNVNNNSKMGLAHVIYVRNRFKKHTGSLPDYKLWAMSYNYGQNGLPLLYKKYGLVRKYYCHETWHYGRKVMFYYENYKNGKYNVIWDDIREKGIVLKDK